MIEACCVALGRKYLPDHLLLIVPATLAAPRPTQPTLMWLLVHCLWASMRFGTCSQLLRMIDNCQAQTLAAAGDPRLWTADRSPASGEEGGSGQLCAFLRLQGETPGLVQPHHDSPGSGV